MKVLFDTSILVAALVARMPQHEQALFHLQQAVAGRYTFLVAAPSLIELYAVLTHLPMRPQITPDMARQLIRSNVSAVAEVVPLETKDYQVVFDRMADLGLSGNIMYDGLVTRAAEKAGVDRLITARASEMLKIWPAGREVIWSL